MADNLDKYHTSQTLAIKNNEKQVNYRDQSINVIYT